MRLNDVLSRGGHKAARPAFAAERMMASPYTARFIVVEWRHATDAEKKKAPNLSRVQEAYYVYADTGRYVGRSQGKVLGESIDGYDDWLPLKEALAKWSKEHAG